MIGAGVTDMIAEAVLGRKLETTGHEFKNHSPSSYYRGGSNGSCS